MGPPGACLGAFWEPWEPKIAHSEGSFWEWFSRGFTMNSLPNRVPKWGPQKGLSGLPRPRAQGLNPRGGRAFQGLGTTGSPPAGWTYTGPPSRWTNLASITRRPVLINVPDYSLTLRPEDRYSIVRDVEPNTSPSLYLSYPYGGGAIWP